MSRIFFLRPRRSESLPSESTCYYRGWRDGFNYGERVTRAKGLAAGFFAGFITASAIVAALLYFGGPQ